MSIRSERTYREKKIAKEENNSSSKEGTDSISQFFYPRRAYTFVKKHGLLSTASKTFRYAFSLAHEKTKTFLPYTDVNSNGVRHKAIIGNAYSVICPVGTDDYEKGLLSSLRNIELAGKKVCLVGGGYGVTARYASRRSNHEVEVFEPSDYLCVTYLKDIENAEINHAYFYTDDETYHSADLASRVETSDLPICDVLVLDCEGAEQPILKNLDQHPSHVIVETHPHLGIKTNNILEILRGNGYTVVNRVVENEEKEITVLHAERIDE